MKTIDLGETATFPVGRSQGHRPDQILTNGIALTIRKIAVIRIIVIILTIFYGE